MISKKTPEGPSVRTQFLIFTLFGEFILPRGGAIWTSDLLSLLDLLGVSERAARTTLSRMARKGWLTTRKEGRCSQYSLTPRGWALLKQGEQRIFEPPFDGWSGMWHIVVYSLPEKKRRLRHALRQRLTWLGFGPLAAGTWISPHDRQTEVKNLCAELGVQEHVEFFSGMHLGSSLDQELIQRCWDLPDLEAQYRGFIARFETEHRKSLNQGNGGPPPKVSFVRRFWLMHHFQAFPRKDPNLPTALLPAEWIGFKARQLFEDYHSLLKPSANQFVDGIMNGDGIAVSNGQPDYPENLQPISSGGKHGHTQKTKK
jgi:phenylacetic acid degradation operon negative regulatory protein